ncbi:hypothetical protein BKA00_002873 [Actinomadura coerulea]|uniref:Uncharacterized protein n=1 Tax=Actinomadura coerulea TaxID=46159 RepID=A0A7X0KZA6_9ACTN|nr:hypothetical protein [Actinomadura coerulea]MBB6395959.1 hypothetical protein [Actinomadura coerulea]GGQ30594.1 hypothetical protein GCM10010187_54340 [Actinomadura coerulea]
MSVTDKQVATLTAQLAGRMDEYKRLYAELDPEEVGHGYSALVGAAAAIAVDRRFVKDDEIADRREVIDYVAELRSRSAEAAKDLEPVVAEQLILHNLGKGDISNFDARILFPTQIIVLAGLVADEQYGEAELTSFIQTARQVADHWIANDQ